MLKSLLTLLVASTVWGAGAKPKVRAITAFIDIDAAAYSSQIGDAVRFLTAAREAYRGAGFEVETIRIATQPFPRYTTGMTRADAVAFLLKLDELASKLGFSGSIGPAMLNDADDPAPVALLAEVLPRVKLNASLVVAAEDGIHWNAVRQSARLIQSLSEHSPHGQANFNFAAIAMLKPYGPFFPGAWHLGGGRTFSVGLESANVVADVLAGERDPGRAEKALVAALAQPLSAAETIAIGVAKSSGWTYAGIDPTPAPLGEVSIGRAMESFTGAPFGTSGTMTAAAIITRAVQAAPVKRVGYSGLMVPVLEDAVLARRWAEGAYNIDSLLAYSAVCAGGLDTVPLPGDTGEDRLARIVGDVATLAFKWNKPLAARLLPVPGKKAGDRTEFEDARMANTILQGVK
jgi:uncharacterized protein (UPF0210 family)